MENKALAKKEGAELSNSAKFANMVMREFAGNVSGAMQVTDYQRSLISGYFVAIDRTLKSAEEERIRKNSNNKDHKYDNELPVTWQNVNLNSLALDVVHYARLGLDMMQPNMLFPIPYKNNKAQKYDVNLMKGYNGIRYIAEKYALEKPKSVTVEVVYSTDRFSPIKKSGTNRVESYEFEITNPFDRGRIIGGFAYLEYPEPSMNELIIMSMHDIEKRKPEYASANFWGGKQKKWENGKQIEVESEGWLDEMVRKTLIREAYGGKHIPVDPQKIDENYQYMKHREASLSVIDAQEEIAENSNQVPIDVSGAIDLPVSDPDTGEVVAPATDIPEADF